MRVPLCAEELRTSPVSRHGPWSKPRNAWKLEARLQTTFPNLRTTGNQSLSLRMHSSSVLNQVLTTPLFVQRTTTMRCDQMRDAVKHETQCGVWTMIHKATTYVNSVDVNVRKNPRRKQKENRTKRARQMNRLCGVRWNTPLIIRG